MARRKSIHYVDNKVFLEAMKEVSVECSLMKYPNCKICVPNGVPLYNIEDPIADIDSRTDPCLPVKEKEVNAIPIDVEYQINESFLNSRKKNNKADITNKRLSQLSPLAKSSAIPIPNNQHNQIELSVYLISQNLNHIFYNNLQTPQHAQ